MTKKYFAVVVVAVLALGTGYLFLRAADKPVAAPPTLLQERRQRFDVWQHPLPEFRSGRPASISAATAQRKRFMPEPPGDRETRQRTGVVVVE